MPETNMMEGVQEKLQLCSCGVRVTFCCQTRCSLRNPGDRGSVSEFLCFVLVLREGRDRQTSERSVGPFVLEQTCEHWRTSFDS